MLQFFNNQQRKERTRDELNQPNGWISKKMFNQQHHRKNDHESSPSFVTDENMDEGLYIADSFTLTSDHSVSEYGELIDADFQGQRFKADQIQNNQIIKQLDAQVSFFASLQSSKSFDPSIELLSSQSSAQFSVHHNESIENLKNQSSKVFLPEIKSLVQQVNLLENDLYEMAREYLRMKTFSQSVIVSVRRLLSQEVGIHLQEYMLRQFKNCYFEQFDGNNIQGNNSQKLNRKPSQNLLTKLNSQQLSYNVAQESRQMSKNIEEIFTLGSSKFKLDSNFDPQTKSKLIKCKSTEKKPVPNFNKNYLQKDKENVYDQIKASQKISQKKPAKKISIKQSQIEVQKMKNESMKFLTRDDSTCTKSTKASTPRNFFNISLSQTSVIATQLLCEVCKTCFQPNEFFQHLSNCSVSQSSSFLKSTSKLAFNYTIIMQKLFGMRQEIESQIELLSLSKQKHNEKAQRQRLKKKLEEDLEKVTKIIEEKQKEMEIHLSKNLGIDVFSLKDSLPIQGKTRKNYH